VSTDLEDEPVENEAGLIVLIGLTGAVLAFFVVLLRQTARSRGRSTRQGPDRDPAIERAPASRPPSAFTSSGLGHLFGGLGHRHRSSSVGARLERAYARIDAVDPYAGARRIGAALADSGLVGGQVGSGGHDAIRPPWQPTEARRTEQQWRTEDE
jgi:hypothetical protein